MEHSSNKSTPPLRFCFHILIGAAGGAGVIIWVMIPPTMLCLFCLLLDLRLHFNLNLSSLHVHILWFSFGMYWARKWGHLGLLRLCLTLWAFLFFDSELSVRRFQRFSTTGLRSVLVSALRISCTVIYPLGVTRLWGILRGGGGTLSIRAVVTT